MSEIHFRDNYQDVSTSSGFQFEFHCERCHDTWRSPFERYAAGTLESALGAAESFFGGFFGSARNAVGNITSAGYSKAKDDALRAVARQATGRFHKCPRCSQNLCDECWNADEGVCVSCVPRLDAELAAIQREAKLQRAREVAYERATVSDEDLQQRAVGCRECGSPVGRGKFCPGCGAPVSRTRTCGHCRHEVPASAKFCPECGR